MRKASIDDGQPVKLTFRLPAADRDPATSPPSSPGAPVVSDLLDRAVQQIHTAGLLLSLPAPRSTPLVAASIEQAIGDLHDALRAARADVSASAMDRAAQPPPRRDRRGEVGGVEPADHGQGAQPRANEGRQGGVGVVAGAAAASTAERTSPRQLLVGRKVTPPA
jgi:hypothetical protein